MQGEPLQGATGIREGDIIAGKYRVERVLGQGGMGVVVAAYHAQLDQRVALKFLLPEAFRNPEAVGRFLREARASAKIASEHVARVTDVGTLENGAPYMVMEYLEGEDLAGWLELRGALPVEQAVEFVIQACVAVADAHAVGIIHRDLKPANLFCIRRADGRTCVKVLDFGISKMSGAGGFGPAAMTQTSAIMGSPLYMSPEQMRSAKTVNGQTDIWALGVILYQLFTGEPPFVADSLPELALRVSTDPPAPLRSRRPEVPPELEAVVLRCLEKDRSRRFADVAEMARALLPYAPAHARTSVDRISGILESSALSATAPAPPGSPPAGVASVDPGPGTLPPLGRTVAEVSRGRWVAGAVVVACVSAAIAAFMSASHSSAPVVGEPAPAVAARPSATPATEIPAAPPSVAPAAASVAPEGADAAASPAPSSSPKPDLIKTAAPKPRPAAAPSAVERAKPAPAAPPADLDPLSRLRPK
jgi:serine/threonine protein kinase